MTYKNIFESQKITRLIEYLVNKLRRLALKMKSFSRQPIKKGFSTAVISFWYFIKVNQFVYAQNVS